MTSDPGEDDADGTVKCLVWDLDETVWHGRLLDGDRPTLRPGLAGVLAELDRRGVVNSIASVNDHDHAWPHLVRLGVADYFVAPEIHMGGKHDSVARIADRLRFRHREMAFIDDDPLQRELVRSLLPGVHVLDADSYAALPDDPRFRPPVTTPESRERRRMLQAELRRQAEEPKYPSAEDFLRACDIRFRGRLATERDAERIRELALRTNRMNATGHRSSAAEIEERLADPARPVLLGDLRDRFGDYGTVAAAFVAPEGDTVHVEGLWISCRVGQRGLPAAFLSFLCDDARGRGATTLSVAYRPNDSNRLAAFHLGCYGFELSGPPGRRRYLLDLRHVTRPYPAWITPHVDPVPDRAAASPGLAGHRRL